MFFICKVMFLTSMVYIYVYWQLVYVFDRSYAVTWLKSTNLMLVMIDSADNCERPCTDYTHLPFKSVENILCRHTYIYIGVT